ncbi:lipoprotein N-acyltransferase Lnb domain-containing protein [Luteimonas sp. A534]
MVGRATRPAAMLGLLLALLACCLPALAAPRIGVATMQPGEIFFERFGHNAIVVDDPAAGPPLSYNFGFFDPEEPDFHQRFMRGDMQYRLAVLPLAQDLAYYESVGRGVAIQWLDLEEETATALAERLAWNARPENASYPYDYFLDNCSTRVRDALDAALGGLLARHLQGRSQGNTFRSEAVRLARPDRLMALGFDLGLGPAADRPNALWEDAFVPMRLAQSLRDVRLADGRPLVVAEEALLPHLLEPEPVPRRVAWWPWLLVGVALAALAWSQRHRPRAVAAAALPVWLLCAALGAVMLYIWLGTAHRFGWANHNLLLFNPLCILLLPGAWRIARGRDGGLAFRIVLAVVTLGLLVAPFLLWMPLQTQRNAHWLALMLPLQLALAAALHARAGPRARGSDEVAAAET